jgi:diaminopimelate decarboxylase
LIHPKETAVIDKLEDVRFKLGQIDGKVDLLLEQGRIQDDRAVDLEARVRKVEGRQHWYAGVAAAMSAAVTYFLRDFVPHS